MVALVDPSTPLLAQITVANEFPNVFEDEVHELPPTREVESAIDLVLNIMPISRAPYWMAPFELSKLKT